MSSELRGNINHPGKEYLAMVQLASKNLQTLHFRRLGITIDLPGGDCRSQALVIDAPQHFFHADFDPTDWEEAASRHHIANQLHIAAMALDILSRAANDDDDIQPILNLAIDALRELDRLAVT